MLAVLLNFILLSSEAAHGQGGFMEFYNKYFNYPGFEGWKFINLAIFVAIGVYLLNKPLSQAFKAKREAVRAELIKAEEEKQAALGELAMVEAKLVGVEGEKAEILQRAKAEALAEKNRLTEQTALDISKMNAQTGGEIARLGQLTRHELKKYAADESIRLAEAKLKSRLDAKSDADLVNAGISAIGGLS